MTNLSLLKTLYYRITLSDIDNSTNAISVNFIQKDALDIFIIVDYKIDV